MIRSAAGKVMWVGRATMFYAVVLGVLVALVLVMAAVASGIKPAEAAFPGKNGKIAFASDRDGNYEIYRMNPDGSNQNNLTASTAIDHNPSWSPNGKQIAFTSNRDGNSEIYRMSATGTLQTRLTRITAFDGYPAYSPNGKKIAFVSNRDGGDLFDANLEIYRMNPDGSNQWRLTNNPAFDVDPSWQPLP